VGVFVGHAEAFQPYGGRHYLPYCSPYPADFTNLYGIGNIPTPPYFSLHPPEYYHGRPIPRTYGYGPYAYPPQTRTPELAPPVPKVIQNRFVPPQKDATKKAEEDKVASSPIRIINPFVTDGEAVAKSWGGRVKIVYPVAVSSGRFRVD